MKEHFINENLFISTVDSFQGQEKPIIILNTVRTSQLGFLTNPNRINVSLSRSCGYLFLIGNFNIYRNNAIWKELLDYIGNKGAIRNADFIKESCSTPLQIASSIESEPSTEAENPNFSLI